MVMTRERLIPRASRLDASVLGVIAPDVYGFRGERCFRIDIVHFGYIDTYAIIFYGDCARMFWPLRIPPNDPSDIPAESITRWEARWLDCIRNANRR
ncbi:MAG: hypothetical protein A3A44_02350 [Candidatus Sungbacteria bacterium RIFCSPLOWO2_01_FULL_60_25]|uniref:Uncharacterized protein n=1 Tax=Candidatus Sungbacteria bacterium RIFCSPLOWO2_01_FULL_60_25 TaxID=1802281 RepID=A0A1G2LDB2_9BACT|nr:MAG: hypothetical protein A3A44_02350 [Candidatus Sungbacteria bacterium RIFCSPLOWO2_01_FULL_60_25]